MQPELFEQMRDLEDRHWWFRGRRRVVAAMLERLGLPEPACLLDLGCGTGGNLQMLAGFGEVTGVELDEHAAELASGRGCAPVLRYSLPGGLTILPGLQLSDRRGEGSGLDLAVGIRFSMGI